MGTEASRLAGIGLDDAGLARQVAEGSEAAFASLYDRHAHAVFGLALRLSPDRAAAEEVVQETFLALWNRAELFDPTVGSLAAWLLAIARNRAIDRVRASARRVRAAPFSALVGDQPDDAATVEWLVASGDALGAGTPAPGPEATFAANETREAIAAAIAGLDDLGRKVILLAYRDGLSQSEIATRLGWPLGTVKTRSRRALRHLREALEAGRAAGSIEPDGGAVVGHAMMTRPRTLDQDEGVAPWSASRAASTAAVTKPLMSASSIGVIRAPIPRGATK
jgi:RNA polymerase sigma-70 factor (ECF subfamily)